MGSVWELSEEEEETNNYELTFSEGDAELEMLRKEIEVFHRHHSSQKQEREDLGRSGSDINWSLSQSLEGNNIKRLEQNFLLIIKRVELCYCSLIDLQYRYTDDGVADT